MHSAAGITTTSVLDREEHDEKIGCLWECVCGMGIDTPRDASLPVANTVYSMATPTKTQIGIAEANKI